MTYSNFEMALKYNSIFWMLKAITNENKITGNPVPIAKTTGKPNPAVAESIIEMSITKNKAPL